MKKNTVCISSEEYSNLISSNSTLIETQRYVAQMVLEEHIRAEKRGCEGVVSCKKIAAIIGLDLPIVEKGENDED